MTTLREEGIVSRGPEFSCLDTTGWNRVGCCLVIVFVGVTHGYILCTARVKVSRC